MADFALARFTASDGYEFAFRQFEPTGRSPAGTVVILPGIQSHGLWYEGTARYLTTRGWLTLAPDRRGSGVNQVARGDAPSFRRLLDDIAEFADGKPRPLIVVGISWGGKLAVALQRRHPGRCDGLVLIGPGLFSRVHPPVRERLAIALSRFWRPNRMFAIPLSDPVLFTANPERQQFISDDFAGLRQATARLLFESRRLDVYLKFVPRHVTVPTLVLLAGQDRIVDNAAIRRYVAKFRGPTEVVEFADAHHTLDFEPGGPPYVGDLSAWLDKVTAQKKPRASE